MAKLGYISFNLLVGIVVLRGQESRMYSKQNVEVDRSALQGINKYILLKDSDKLGNGIHRNHTSHYLKKSESQNYPKTSSTSDVNNKTSLPHHTDLTVTPKLHDFVFPQVYAKTTSTQRITSNPVMYTAIYQYDSTLRKNPLLVRFSRIIRLNKTKSDTKTEPDSRSRGVILEGQIDPVNSVVSVLSNTTKRPLINIPISHFHTNDKQHKKIQNNVKQQRILSTTKILNKRNAVGYDIIGEENKVPSEKQQHKGNAFNDASSGIGNGTEEQAFSRKHLPFSFNSNIRSNQGPQMNSPLSVEVYKRLSDAVVLDWYISLSDKDQMSTCDVAYVKSDYESNSKKAMTTQEERKQNFMGQLLSNKYASDILDTNQKSRGALINSYIPPPRIFVIAPLESNRTYIFQMACVDTKGHRHVSKQLVFKTGMSDASSYHDYNHTDLRKVNNAGGKSNKKQRIPFSWFSQHHLASASRSYSLPRSNGNEALARAASSVASKSLPAISSSAVGAAVVGRNNNMNIMERNLIRDQTSPHFVLGVACSIVGLIILMVTVGLAGRRYSKYRSSQTRLWEQEVVEQQTSHASGATMPSNNHSSVSSIDLDENNTFCQLRTFDSATSGNVLRSFPPPYTETCPLSTMSFDDTYSTDQGLSDGILYELDSQYLHQLLPSNAANNMSNVSSNCVYNSYINNVR